MGRLSFSGAFPQGLSGLRKKSRFLGEGPKGVHQGLNRLRKKGKQRANSEGGIPQGLDRLGKKAQVGPIVREASRRG